MPTYHTQTGRDIPALPEDFQRYIAGLEDLLTTTDRYLRKRNSVSDLRQAMRQAESAGLESGRLQKRQTGKAPAQQPGQNLQPPRECEYCGATPGELVIWIDERTGKRWKHYLCADCDEREIRELNE